MNAQPRLIVCSAFALGVIAVLSSACFKDDPCGAGLVENTTNGNCVKPPPPPAPDAAAASDAGGDGGEADGGGTPAAATLGKTCSAEGDCGPDAPKCGAPQLPYCTQTDCNPGEKNAGACTAGFICQKIGDYPSFCFKQ
jgi:hypothetical protein